MISLYLDGRLEKSGRFEDIVLNATDVEQAVKDTLGTADVDALTERDLVVWVDGEAVDDRRLGGWLHVDGDLPGLDRAVGHAAELGECYRGSVGGRSSVDCREGIDAGWGIELVSGIDVDACIDVDIVIIVATTTGAEK